MRFVHMHCNSMNRYNIYRWSARLFWLIHNGTRIKCYLLFLPHINDQTKNVMGFPAMSLLGSYSEIPLESQNGNRFQIGLATMNNVGQGSHKKVIAINLSTGIPSPLKLTQLHLMICGRKARPWPDLHETTDHPPPYCLLNNLASLH